MLRFTMATALMLLPAGAMAQDDAKLELGKEVFLERAEPQCGVCHTLADAGTTGTVGPSLDDLEPSQDQVATAVKNGGELMPAFGEQLSDDEIEAVAHYVAAVAGQGGD